MVVTNKHVWVQVPKALVLSQLPHAAFPLPVKVLVMEVSSTTGQCECVCVC